VFKYEFVWNMNFADVAEALVDFCEISCSHGIEYEGDSLLGYSTT
jgi:hypothetical protein